MGTAKVTPFPQPGLGAFKGALWGPVAEFATGQVAGNSNLRLGDRARGGLVVVTCGYFTIALANFESSWREAMSLHRRNIAMERQAGSHDESFRRIPGGAN